MTDSARKPINRVKVGDKIADNLPGADPGTKDQAHTVTAIHITYTDRDYTDVTIDTGHGPATITGTAQHPYWDQTTHAWTDADRLHLGDQLQTTDGRPVLVVALRDYTATAVTYNLTIDNLHTYYVEGGLTPVLVRNDPTDPLKFFGDYTGRLDQFTARGGQASFEIHVYYQGTEYGIYGPAGWFPKHGLGVPTDAPPQLESVLKGYSVDWMRHAGVLKPGDSIKGNDWMRPGLTQGTPGC